MQLTKSKSTATCTKLFSSSIENGPMRAVFLYLRELSDYGFA